MRKKTVWSDLQNWQSTHTSSPTTLHLHLHTTPHYTSTHTFSPSTLHLQYTSSLHLLTTPHFTSTHTSSPTTLHQHLLTYNSSQTPPHTPPHIHLLSHTSSPTTFHLHLLIYNSSPTPPHYTPTHTSSLIPLHLHLLNYIQLLHLFNTPLHYTSSLTPPHYTFSPTLPHLISTELINSFFIIISIMRSHPSSNCEVLCVCVKKISCSLVSFYDHVCQHFLISLSFSVCPEFYMFHLNYSCTFTCISFGTFCLTSYKFLTFTDPYLKALL